MNCHFDIVSEDKYGALARVVGVFASLGLNIEQLSAFPSMRAGYTDIRVRLKTDEDLARKLSRKLRRIVTVVEVRSTLEPLEQANPRGIRPPNRLQNVPATAF